MLDEGQYMFLLAADFFDHLLQRVIGVVPFQQRVQPLFQADITSPKSAKPLALTGLEGDFGFHMDGYISTSNKLNICCCSSVGVLF